MPTYDYVCKACGESMEIFHSMTEPARKKCPSCGKNGLERQLGTGGAIIFKGGGFYQTDYRSEGYKKAAEADAKGAAPAGKGDSGSTTPAAGGQSAGAEKAPEKPAKPAAAAKPDKVKKASAGA